MKTKKETIHSIVASGVSAIMILSAVIVHADTTSTSVTVGNAAPSISATTFNSGSAIVLTENTTTAVYATTTVTDSNGCGSIYGVTANIRRSGVAAASCDQVGEADNNSCYPVLTCTVEAGTCTGGSDTAANYVCSTSLQFYADPTDSGSFSAQNWTVDLIAGDGVATTTEAANASVELNSLAALNVDASLAYGTIAANTDTGALNSTTTVTNTGNTNIDPDISGTNMTSGGDTIAVGNQEYSSSIFTYGSGTDLSTSPTSLDLTLAKPTSASAVTDDVSWGIAIPGGTPPGNYTGTNTFTAVAN